MRERVRPTGSVPQMTSAPHPRPTGAGNVPGRLTVEHEARPVGQPDPVGARWQDRHGIRGLR